MKITKLIEQLQELSDRYYGDIDVVLEYKFRDKTMINSKPKVYTKCIYYKEPKPIPNSNLVEIGKLNVIISNGVRLYTGKNRDKEYKLGLNNF